jgi:hypothetical protein
MEIWCCTVLFSIAKVLVLAHWYCFTICEHGNRQIVFNNKIVHEFFQFVDFSVSVRIVGVSVKAWFDALKHDSHAESMRLDRYVYNIQWTLFQINLSSTKFWSFSWLPINGELFNKTERKNQTSTNRYMQNRWWT